MDQMSCHLAISVEALLVLFQLLYHIQ